MRSATPMILAAGLVLSLAACAPTPPPTGDCTPTPSGDFSSGVTVEGDFGAKPEVAASTPTSATATERSVVITGDGELAVEGDIVRIDYTLLSGKTGEELTSTTYTEGSGEKLILDSAQLLPGIVKTLECSTVGSRVVGVIPAADAFGTDGGGVVDADTDIIFVADVVEIVPPADPPLPRADGEDQEPQPGFPTVTLDDDGRPTITLPDTEPPTELQIAVLKKGSGATVQDGDKVTVHYVGLNWNTGEIFDESWARGAPATFPTGGVIAGFSAALVGQTVGSQVIAVIPPDQGYGPDGRPPSIGGTDTLVFVVDILGVE